MSFQIKKSHIVEMLHREMESYKSFQKNIDNQIEELRTSLHAADDRHFADGIRFNKQMQRICLERAAALLEAIGLYSEDAGDTIDYLSIYEKVLAVSTFTKLSN